MSTDEIDLTQISLFDHHCHSVEGRDLSRVEFESLISESSWPAPSGCSRFDTQVGFAVRRHCAPILGLPVFAEPDEYVDRRKELGADEVNRRFLGAAGLGLMGIETGIDTPTFLDSAAMTSASGAPVVEIVRLERLAEDVAAHMRRAGIAPTDFATQFETALDHAVDEAVGVKSIAAYRVGLDFTPERPARSDVALAARAWFIATDDCDFRLADSTLIRHLIWSAIDRACVIQLHIGYGDDDVDLHRCNPLLLTGLLRSTADSGARFALLHCYPYQREAAYLTDVFPHVYLDTGLAINYTGSRSAAVIAESMELAPFHKLLFSTDAFGAAELYLLGALLFRRGLGETLEKFRALDGWPTEECLRIARLIGYQNAASLYSVNGGAS